jgi:hypothetical protein
MGMSENEKMRLKEWRWTPIVLTTQNKEVINNDLHVLPILV